MLFGVRTASVNSDIVLSYPEITEEENPWAEHAMLHVFAPRETVYT